MKFLKVFFLATVMTSAFSHPESECGKGNGHGGQKITYCECKTGWFSDSYYAHLIIVDLDTGKETEKLISGIGGFGGHNAKERCEDKMNEKRICW